jgi:hypothetical protein
VLNKQSIFKNPQNKFLLLAKFNAKKHTLKPISQAIQQRKFAFGASKKTQLCYRAISGFISCNYFGLEKFYE